jgi:hypothetical protein
MKLGIATFWISLAVAVSPVRAQVDLSGEWAARFHEDQHERIPGPDVGDYLGIPINDDLRLRADSWDASLLTLLERQCIPHPSTYSLRGPADLRISNEIDPVTQEIRSITIYGTFGRATRVIWMDGRPHPPEYAPHTWAGFSTGHWEGDTLTVETTHIKAGYLRRNGVVHSDEATMTEHIYRHGNVLTITSIREDPIYLTEPYVQSTNWVLNNAQTVGGGKCIAVEEIANRKKGYVPHRLPGKNVQLIEFSRMSGVPFESTRGGADTMYPEYRIKLRQMLQTSQNAPAKQ